MVPMTNSVGIYMAGDPVGQPRARCIPLPGGKVKMVSTADKKKKAYKTHLISVMRAAMKAAKWEPPKLVRCDVEAFFYTRKSQLWGKYCGKKPDRDNIDKLILDCAEAAGVFTGGDEGVVEGRIRKIWSEAGGVTAVFQSLDHVGTADDDAEGDLGAFQP